VSLLSKPTCKTLLKGLLLLSTVVALLSLKELYCLRTVEVVITGTVLLDLSEADWVRNIKVCPSRYDSVREPFFVVSLTQKLLVSSCMASKRQTRSLSRGILTSLGL